MQLIKSKLLTFHSLQCKYTSIGMHCTVVVYEITIIGLGSYIGRCVMQLFDDSLHEQGASPAYFTLKYFLKIVLVPS